MGANLGFTMAYSRIQKSSVYREENFKLLKRIAFGQVFFDLVLITIGIHFSGGGISPVPLVYIIYIGLISIFFPATLLILLNMIALSLYSTVMLRFMAGQL